MIKSVLLYAMSFWRKHRLAVERIYPNLPTWILKQVQNENTKKWLINVMNILDQSLLYIQ